MIERPPIIKFTNFKVRTLLMWMNFISTLIWIIGVAFSIDKITMRFKYCHGWNGKSHKKDEDNSTNIIP